MKIKKFVNRYSTQILYVLFIALLLAGCGPSPTPTISPASTQPLPTNTMPPANTPTQEPTPTKTPIPLGTVKVCLYYEGVLTDGMVDIVYARNDEFVIEEGWMIGSNGCKTIKLIPDTYRILPSKMGHLNEPIQIEVEPDGHYEIDIPIALPNQND